MSNVDWDVLKRWWPAVALTLAVLPTSCASPVMPAATAQTPADFDLPRHDGGGEDQGLHRTADRFRRHGFGENLSDNHEEYIGKAVQRLGHHQQRLRFADDFPMMLEVRYISPELCP